MVDGLASAAPPGSAPRGAAPIDLHPQPTSPRRQGIPARASGGPPRIALAHDWLCGYRGGEAVLDQIADLVAREFRTAGLYVMFDDGRPIAPAIDALRADRRGHASRVVPSPINMIPGASGRLRRWLLPLYPAAVGALASRLADAHRREKIDLVISTSSAAIKGLKPPPGVPHICYCHSPARYVWSRRDEYSRGADRSLHARLRAEGLRRFGEQYRTWDRATASHVTTFLANSDHTAGEIVAAYQRPSLVVHPPVRTEYFTPDRSVKRRSFWLVVSALEPYKRVDLAIAAANKAGHELVIAGDGSHRKVLECMAGPGVRFQGRVPLDKLRQLYRSAGLLLFPQVEDFGIVAAEAQACGLPVVARRAGGAMDIVVEGVTGALFEEPEAGFELQDEVESLLGAVGRVRRVTSAACRVNAERFSESTFQDRIRLQIERALAGPHS